MKLHQALVSFLQNDADDTNVYNVYNEYASADDYIYTSIEDIAELFATDDPTSLARKVFFGNVESWHGCFFTLNGYGNIDGFSSLTDRLCPIDFKLLAEQIIANQQFDAVGFDADPYLSTDDE